MAKTMILTCDVHADGTTPATKSVALSIGKRHWSVDVCAEHEGELQTFLDRYAPNAARKKAVSAAQEARNQRTAIREWAKKNKVKLPQRGRIPNAVIEKYEASRRG